jgi:hypothetical protein
MMLSRYKKLALSVIEVLVVFVSPQTVIPVNRFVEITLHKPSTERCGSNPGGGRDFPLPS